MENNSFPKAIPLKNQRGSMLIVLSILVLLIMFGGGTYYLATKNEETPEPLQNTQPTPTPQDSSKSNITATPSPINKTPKTERIVLQEGYYFDVTVPEGYLLAEGLGDYANYIIDSDGEKLIGFQKSSGGGVLGRLNPVVIDNVPLVVMYREDIGCPADIFSEKAHNPQAMYFGIITWCKDAASTQSPVYKKVINSIVFGHELREVLLGNKPAPPYK